MPKQCQDAYFVQFNLFPEMLSYHEDLRRRSRWVHTSVKSLEVAPLDKTAPLFSDHTGFDAEVTEDAIADTADHLGLAVKVDGRWFPLRDTSYPSLLDRAKINGTALPKLSREKLSGVLNTCLPLHKSEALMLIRDEKVSAAHSGDTRDYSVLEIDQLLDSLQAMQIKNRMEVSNGDTGYIRKIENSGDDWLVEVDFGEERVVDYADAESIGQLELAYAQTIHKSQGSEYDSVLISIQHAHRCFRDASGLSQRGTPGHGAVPAGGTLQDAGRLCSEHHTGPQIWTVPGA